MMDLPLLLSTNEGRVISYLATYADPWASVYAVFSSPSQEGFKQRGVSTVPTTIGTLLEDVRGGPIGRFDYGNQLHVELFNNNFQSVDQLGLFNGSNLLAIESSNGDYELLQFQTADLQEDGTWILSNLLRAQFNTESAMQSGLSKDAMVIAVDEALVAIELDPLEIGLEQNWRIGPARDPVATPNYETLTHVNNRRLAKMLNPVHLKSKVLANGDLEFSWIRRGRINSDNWHNAEIPLDANTESYQLNIFDLSGVSKRQISQSSNTFLYSASSRIEDMGAIDVALKFQVAQIGDNGLPGFSSMLQVTA